jgi:hypothetical protein
MLPSGDQSGCNAVASTNDQTACQVAVGGFDDAGLCH